MKENKTIEQLLYEILQNSQEPLLIALREQCKQPPAVLNPAEVWLDNQDVMNMLHISARTLQTFRKNATIPYSCIGRKRYYRQSDIQRILNDNYIMYQLRNEKKQKMKSSGNCSSHFIKLPLQIRSLPKLLHCP